MLRNISFIAALFPATAFADAQKLTGPEIQVLLPTITAYGESTKQVFYEGGTTDYIDGGRPSVGYWRTSETQYCSKWPPFGGWTCYDVMLDEGANEVRWIGDSGKPIVNRIERNHP